MVSLDYKRFRGDRQKILGFSRSVCQDYPDAGSSTRELAKVALFAALLGATPGCVGAFACVTLYTHGLISLGAIVACMVATCGDEAFLLLSLSPGFALWLFALLFVFGIVVGFITDKIFVTPQRGCRLAIHQEESKEQFSVVLSPEKVWFSALTLGLLALGIFTPVGGKGGFWVVYLCLAFLHLGLVLFASDHFLSCHILEHILKKHMLNIFVWIWGVMLLLHLGSQYFELGAELSNYKWQLLLLACLVGVLPESGPNIVFVSLFAAGMIPFPILLANSIVQDGHGMLPLLAETKRDFLLIKSINFAAGLFIGAVFLLFWG